MQLPYPWIYVLNHSLHVAHSLDSLSSLWVERDKRRLYRPAHPLDSLPDTQSSY